MMTRWTRGLGLIVFVMVATGPGLRADEASDLKPLAGKWVGPNDTRMTFEGKTLKATVNGSDYVAEINVEPKANPFATIDFKVSEGTDDAKGKVSKGIYKIQDGKLIICVSVPGRDTRPTAFEAIEDETVMFELKKAS